MQNWDYGWNGIISLQFLRHIANVFSVKLKMTGCICQKQGKWQTNSGTKFPNIFRLFCWMHLLLCPIIYTELLSLINGMATPMAMWTVIAMVTGTTT